MDSAVASTKPTPKPRLSKISHNSVQIQSNTEIPEIAVLEFDKSQDRRSINDSNLDSADEILQNLNEILNLNSPDSLENDDSQENSNFTSYENPEYTSFPFIRKQNSNLNDSCDPRQQRASDLMWFNSGVPSEYLHQSRDEHAKPTPKLYPDLDALFSNSNEFETNSNDLRVSQHDIPASSASNHSKIASVPKRASIRSSNHQDIGDFYDDENVIDGKLAFNDSHAITPTNDDRSMASSDLNDDLIGSRESLPPLPVQPRNPTPVIVSHPHRSSSVPIASNVCYVGFLSKLGHKKKDNSRRWSVLQHGGWSFFASETDEKPLETISCKNILLVTIESPSITSKDMQPSDAQASSFGVYLAKEGGKIEHLTFFTDCVDDRTAWLTFLSKSIIHGETAELCERIDRAGPVYLKQGTTAEWETGWLVLIGAKLLYSCQTDVCSFEIDVRKIIRLRTVDDQTDHCPMVKGVNPNPFVITTEGSALYIQSGNNIVTEKWKTGIETILMQRTSLLPEQRLNFDDVPVLVEKCINFIAVHGMSVEGIHRLSGTSSKVRMLYEEFQKDPYSVHLRLEDYTVHDVASVLRKFFRQLHEPLVTTKLRPEFIQKSCVEEPGSRRNEFKTLLKRLPKVNYRTLRKILGHLRCVDDNSAVNMMNIQNLAAIFGPTLFSVDRDALEGVNFTSTSQAIMAIGDMLMDYNRLFDVDESELMKESRIQQIAKDLNNQPHLNKKPPAGELLLSIHTVQRDGVCFNMPITNKLTSTDVCDFAIERRKLNALREEVALFEVVCNGELQRLILSDEKVLDVISRWTTWPLEERANNFLIVKLDFVTDRVKNMAVGPTLFPTCEIQFSETKSFKKFTFQFSQGAVVQYKDSKAKKELNQWKAENLLWYFGCEKKRDPPSKYCLTFLPKNDSMKRSKSFPFFGKTMCFKDEIELYKWLCTVLLFNIHKPPEHHFRRLII